MQTSLITLKFENHLTAKMEFYVCLTAVNVEPKWMIPHSSALNAGHQSPLLLLQPNKQHKKEDQAIFYL